MPVPSAAPSRAAVPAESVTPDTDGNRPELTAPAPSAFHDEVWFLLTGIREPWNGQSAQATVQRWAAALEATPENAGGARALDAFALLTRVLVAGMATRDIARLTTTPLATVRAWWRDGAPIDREDELARVVLLLEVLGTQVPDPVAWLESPARQDVLLSRLDILTSGRFDLVLELVAADGDEATASVLDRFDPHWRTRFGQDHQFEVFTAADGVASIRPRQPAPPTGNSAAASCNHV